MYCPHCSHPESRVLDTRIQKEGEIRRRRECLECKGRFSTVESVLHSYPHIIKKDGRREPFSKDKIKKGLQYACLKRPVSLAQIEHVVNKVSQYAMEHSKKEIAASALGHFIMRELRQLDDVAYIRFASVYRTFKDVHEFVEVLEGSDAPETIDTPTPTSALDH
ncbi:MAG: transcriptional regulator NrdR [Bdellovibrionaceae bacterium]|nr:transcriptional regulator NrdR [Pseudobdellovibrionaceae bacterium]|tara:strand:+ start:34620 stop:35111 length:492 start_codon:yes stop_codon:yes gene_type:complete